MKNNIRKFVLTGAAAIALCGLCQDAAAQMQIFSGGQAVTTFALTTADSVTFSIDVPVQELEPSSVGGSAPKASEAVDLGLSVKWAPWNVGASKAEDYGAYFAWGEINASKESYDWKSYIFYEGYAKGQYFFYKYDGSDGKTTLDPADDAATAAWGTDWRMPTYAEWNELNTHCTWTWTAVNGVKGYTVKGPNGNSIFLPAAGYRFGSGLYYAGSYGYYWSSELDSRYSSLARYCEFCSDAHGADYNSYRRCGQSVRAVAPGIASAE